jgi:signal transduction histidine kinase
MSTRSRRRRPRVGVVDADVEMTDLKRAEERLRRLNATLERRVRERTALAERRARDLRRLAAQLERAEHEERRRLAGILHDELQQLLFAAKMLLPPPAERQPTPWRPALDRVEELLDESLSVSRHLGQELSPRVLEVGTLADLLSWIARWYGEHHGLDVTVEVKGKVPRVPRSLRLFVFRSVRELFLNVVKHSGVHEAHVRVSWRRPRLGVEVSDGGRGFNPAALEGDRPGGLGLFLIRERLEALDGRLEIVSEVGGGARFRLVVPVVARAAAPDTPRAASAKRKRRPGTA